MNPDAPQQLAVLYARLMDDKLFDRLEEIMVPDVVVAAPEFECLGVEAFREQVQLLHNFSATMHLIGNQFGEWDGDTYQGETYCVATHIHEPEGVARKWEVGIRYQDTIVGTGSGYKYSRRYLNILWQSDTRLEA